MAEGSGENLFFVRDGVIYALEHSVNLEGITRDSVIRIAKDLATRSRWCGPPGTSSTWPTRSS